VAAPQIDDWLAIDEQLNRRANILPSIQIRSERLLYWRKPVVTRTLDVRITDERDRLKSCGLHDRTIPPAGTRVQ
jgi:hypothetical protein